MEKFIDIHCHILPGVDDGARDLAGALALIDMAVNDGTGTLVLTPHYRGVYRRNTPQQLRQVFRELQQAAPQVELFLGNEVSYEPELAEKLAEGRVLTLGDGPYVLLEMPVVCTARQVLDAVVEIRGGGMIPILAHVERYEAFLRDRGLVDAAVELGALVQINADSVLGQCGFGVKRYCHWLLKSRRAHFVASDAHDEKDRPPKLMECWRWVCRKYGEDYAAALFRENARVVLGADEDQT